MTVGPRQDNGREVITNKRGENTARLDLALIATHSADSVSLLLTRVISVQLHCSSDLSSSHSE